MIALRAPFALLVEGGYSVLSLKYFQILKYICMYFSFKQDFQASLRFVDVVCVRCESEGGEMMRCLIQIMTTECGLGYQVSISTEVTPHPPITPDTRVRPGSPSSRISCWLPAVLRCSGPNKAVGLHCCSSLCPRPTVTPLKPNTDGGSRARPNW